MHLLIESDDDGHWIVSHYSLTSFQLKMLCRCTGNAHFRQTNETKKKMRKNRIFGNFKSTDVAHLIYIFSLCAKCIYKWARRDNLELGCIKLCRRAVPLSDDESSSKWLWQHKLSNSCSCLLQQKRLMSRFIATTNSYTRSICRVRDTDVNEVKMKIIRECCW